MRIQTFRVACLGILITMLLLPLVAAAGTYGVAHTLTYQAWDNSANAPKTNDGVNHTLRWIKDGASAAPTNSPVEVDATNAPGIYSVALTAAECQAAYGTLAGKSATANITLSPVSLSFDRLPAVAPGSNGGLPTVDASNHVAGVQATLDVNVTQVSGDATAADNLEAILDGTGGRAKFVATTGEPGIEISSASSGDAALDIRHTSSGAAVFIQGTAQPDSYALQLSSYDSRGIDGLAVDVDKVSGDSAAADNLEAILDDTGGQMKLTTATGKPGLEIQSSTAGEAGLSIIHTEATSHAVVIQATDTNSSAIQIQDDTGKGINSSSGLTGIGDAAATAILTTPANTLDTDANGAIEMPDVDGVTDAKLREMMLAMLAGTTTLTDNGDGTKTLRFFKQNGTTALLDVTFNTSGEWTATDIDP